MKKAQFLGVSVVLGLGVLFSSCESLKKMAKNHASVKYEVTPSPLEMHGDKVKVAIEGTIPAKYFWTKAILVFQPTLKYEGGQQELKPIVLRGLKTEGQGTVINNKTGGEFSYSDEVAYIPQMEECQLVVNPVGYPEKKAAGMDVTNQEQAATVAKNVKMGERSIAVGTMVTSTRIDRDHSKVSIVPDKYEKETAPNALNGSVKDTLYQEREVNGQFDLILTNPPFSVELDNDTKKTIKHDFMFGEKKNSENLFIERWYQLLRENGRVAAVLPESVFDTTENKYIRLFIYKYFKIKAVVSLPQLAFEPYTSTKTSILFAQKKTKEEIAAWNDAWDTASKDYSQLKTRVDNLISVYDGRKLKAKLPSIKNLTSDQEVALLQKMLKYYITDTDRTLDTNGLIAKYREELESLCSPDKDTKETFGFVNTWWVFGEVSKTLNYDVFMAETDCIGYKRSKRGEKEMPNKLFRSNATGVIVDDGLQETILDYMREIQWD